MQIIRKHDPKIAKEFFFKFARFEYALKVCGYHNENGDVRIDWNGFARALTGVFEEPLSPELKRAIEYYSDHPPKKQVVRNGKIQWQDAPLTDNETSQRILTYVRRVRNNLFHGGKFKGEHLEDPERSDDLMRHGLVVLDACLSYDDNLRNAYLG